MSSAGLAAGDSEGGFAGNEVELLAFYRGGSSKTWRVDLSDVTASIVDDGDIDMLKTKAGSTPRRSSATRAQLAVEKTRIKVPVSLAVASSSPSRLRSMARKGELCAGMMLTFPDSSSTICILPCD